MAEISTNPDSAASALPAISRSQSSSRSQPALPDVSSETSDGREIQLLQICDTNPGDIQQDVPPVVAAVLSSTAISFYTSLTFHLLLWGIIAVFAGWLGLEWIVVEDSTSRPLMAALGEENIEDELPHLDFSGDEALVMDTPASTIEQIAQQLQRSDSGWLKSTEDVALKSVAGSESIDPDANGSGVLLKVPKSGLAVTKGSFTAFTIPASPKPGQQYAIVIEVQLPEDVKRFRVSDLSGEVRGSDKYSQKIPYDGRYDKASGYPAKDKKIIPLNASSILDVVDSRVQIVVKVPGAARLVKDTITIRSRKLKEEQELTLVFGAPESSMKEDETDDDEMSADKKEADKAD